jgi:hypothetical protein
MRRARIAILSALVGAVLVVLPLPTQAEHRAVTVAPDPFDVVAARTAAALVYRDSNRDGVIRPDRFRARGLDRALYVTGADEVKLYLPDNAGTAGDPNELQSPSLDRQIGAVMASCWQKYGFAKSEASWWSDGGAKYTLAWHFAIDYWFEICGYPQGDVDTRYVAALYSTRNGAATPAYLTNNNAAWHHYTPDFSFGEHAYRDFGTTYESDGSKTYLGTSHEQDTGWFWSESETLRATWTAPSPDHTTNVYRGFSQISNKFGEIY